MAFPRARSDSIKEEGEEGERRENAVPQKHLRRQDILM